MHNNASESFIIFRKYFLYNAKLNVSAILVSTIATMLSTNTSDQTILFACFSLFYNTTTHFIACVIRSSLHCKIYLNINKSNTKFHLAPTTNNIKYQNVTKIKTITISKLSQLVSQVYLGSIILKKCEPILSVN